MRLLLILSLSLLLASCSDKPSPPPDASTQISAESDYQFVGSVNSDVYHRPGCRYAERIQPENLVKFKDAEAADRRGYRPCKVCKPR